MRDILGFFTGRVEVAARGNQTEAFLNLLRRYRIPARRIRCGRDGQLRFSLPCRAFCRLRTPAFKTGMRIKIMKKRGLFMVLRPFRRRYGLLVGLVLFYGVLIYCSFFIWRIEVVGCEQVSSTQILEDLKSYGIDVGCRRNIDVGKIENSYLISNDRLSWLSINIKGTTAYIEVKEKDLTPKVQSEHVPTNIYAARDGVILSIEDYRGTRMVQKGEAVLAGDLLVTGDTTDSYGIRRLTHCNAVVMARTVRKEEFSVPLQEVVRKKTGKKKKFYSIFLGNFKIPLYFNKKISYNEYNSVKEEEVLRIGSFALPIKICKESAEEVVLETVNRSADEARAQAERLCAFYREDRLSHLEILDYSAQTVCNEQELLLSATFVCRENIGIEKEIEE